MDTPTVEMQVYFTNYSGTWQAWTLAPGLKNVGQEKVYRLLIPVPAELLAPAIEAEVKDQP